MDGRPPGNTGCCRLFFFFGLPSPLAPAPHPPQAPPAAGPSHPTTLRAVACLPAPRGVGGRGPDSRCRPGLPPRGPRAPPHSASRKPEDRRGRGGGGWVGGGGGGALCLGLPWQASGTSGRGPGPSPGPSPTTRGILAGSLWVSCRRAHNTLTQPQHSLTHTHNTHTHTHTHTHTPAPEKGQEPETTGKGDGERGRERQTARGPHRLPKPRPPHPAPSILGSPRPPVDQTPTVAHRHTHTHALTRSASGLGAGAGSRLRWPSRRGPLRPRMRGSLGVPTGDCQPQGTAPSRGPPAHG